jgi:hypothetical protein
MPIDEDIKQIRNDIDRVKQDLDSINRIQILASSGVIVQDIRRTVGKSKQMIAALFLTKDWLSSLQLSEALRIDQGNLDKVVKALIDGGLLYREKRGKFVHYRRTTRLDLIGFDKIPEFSAVFEAWQNSANER